MRTLLLALIAAILCGCSSVAPPADSSSDAPDGRVTTDRLATTYASYTDALAAWRKPEEINDWIATHFVYDIERAVELSESQRALRPPPQIHEPAAFFAQPTGVCVDLARFAAETMNLVAPELRPRYLMIEFRPTELRGQLLRRHWLAMYTKHDGIYFFADSKRPGVIAGPYPSTQAFVVQYQRFRGRDIVAHRELVTNKRKSKALFKRSRGDA